MGPQERLVGALEARDQDPKILADVPVLEKISALRNVALRIGEGNIWGADIPRAQRAVKLLELALQLHEKELQNNDHPCQFPFFPPHTLCSATACAVAPSPPSSACFPLNVRLSSPRVLHCLTFFCVSCRADSTRQ